MREDRRDQNLAIPLFYFGKKPEGIFNFLLSFNNQEISGKA